MIIVDTNIIAYLYLSASQSINVDKLYKQDPDWHAPRLWRSEFRNILALYLRQKIVNFDTAIAIMKQAEVQLQNKEHNISSPSIIELVAHSNCSAYDCEFIALAIELDVPLITEDKKLLSAFPSICFSTDNYLLNQS